MQSLQKHFLRVKKAEQKQTTTKLFEVNTSDDRIDRWEVKFFYYDEEAERASFDRVVLLFQFCKDDIQVPPKVSVLRPRITGVGLFGGALCFDRAKMWSEYGSDMEAFLLAMRLHLIYQVQAKLEEPPPPPSAPAPASTTTTTTTGGNAAAATNTASSSSAASIGRGGGGRGSGAVPPSSSSSSSTLLESSFSPQERANGFNHIMRTHWDWKLVDISEDGSAVAMKQDELDKANRQESDRLLVSALNHLSCRRMSFALQAITEAIQLNKTKSELYYRRATVFKLMGALTLAETDLETALTKKPVFSNAKPLLDDVKKQIMQKQQQQPQIPSKGKRKREHQPQQPHPRKNNVFYVSATGVRPSKGKGMRRDGRLCTSIKEALELANDGDEVFICAGVFRSQNLLVVTDVTISAFPLGSRVEIEGSGEASSVFDVWSHKAVLNGLSIEHSDHGSAVKVSHGHCEVVNCAVRGSGENTMGLLVEGETSSVVANACSITSTEFAVVVRQKASCALQNCTCDSRNGIIAETAAVCSIQKCILHGPLVYTDFTHGSVIDSEISDSKSLGLSFQGRTEEILVKGNKVKGNRSVGMLACRGATVLVTDNEFLENMRTQVEIQGETNVRIVNNRIRNGEVNGILVTAQATLALIENNEISGHRNAGISVLEGSNARIVGNTIRSCGASGVFFTGNSGGEVLRNTISHCYIAGLEFEGDCGPIVKENVVCDCVVGIQSSLSSASLTAFSDTILLNNRINVLHSGAARFTGDARGLGNGQITRAIGLQSDGVANGALVQAFNSVDDDSSTVKGKRQTRQKQSKKKLSSKKSVGFQKGRCRRHTDAQTHRGSTKKKRQASRSNTSCRETNQKEDSEPPVTRRRMSQLIGGKYPRRLRTQHQRAKP